MNRTLLLVAVSLLPIAGKAQELGTFTLLEGSARVLRGTAVLRAVEGMKFQNGDIVETSSPGFVQAEFGGGTIAAVGPTTRVWFRSSGGRNELILMSGWLKGETSGGAYRCVSPLLTANTKIGAVILHSAPGAAELFVESGSANVEAEGAAGHSVAGKSGQFLTRRSGKNVVVGSRPDGAFVDAMPRPFRDTLPPRVSRFAGKKAPEPKLDHDVTYAEIEPWMKLSKTWRRSLEERFQPRLKDAAFRKEVEPHLADYPEWDRVLHPEKYQTNPPSAPTEKPTSPPGSY